ncbi:hypothetical protein Tco_1185490 [Tanacetum coccineum]
MIREQVVREYVLEFLSSFKFGDHVMELDIADTMVFQLGGVKRNMSMRPNNYNLMEYFVGISTRNHYDIRYHPSYTTIKNPICRLVPRLLTLSVAACNRHSAKEKVTLDDLFLLHNIDEGEMVDVPWTMAKFLFDKEKGYKKKSLIVGAHLIGRIAKSYGLIALAYMRIVTLGQETSLINVAKLVDLGICTYNGLGYGELVDDQINNSEDEAAAAKARRIREENEGGVRRHPNMSFTNRLSSMDERMSDMDTNIFKLNNDVDELTAVVSGMSEQYDQFYREFNTMREEQQSPQDFSTAPITDPFGLFGTLGAGPSTSQNPRNDMEEE